MATSAFIKKYEARIKKGIALLDEDLGRKNWAKKVDFTKLDLQKNCTCILGEVYGNYFAGTQELNLDPYSEANKCGFILDPEENESNQSLEQEDKRNGRYRLLTALWVGALYKLGIKG